VAQGNLKKSAPPSCPHCMKPCINRRSEIPSAWIGLVNAVLTL
jgi:hypothetical protein